MQAPKIFAFQSDFTFKDINPAEYGFDNLRLKINGVIQVITDYTIVNNVIIPNNANANFINIFTGFGIARLRIVNNNLLILKKGDVVTLEHYTNTSFTTLIESISTTVLKLETYLELSTPNFTNGISATETTDKSSVMNTPIVVNPCDTATVNAHRLPKASFITDTDASKYYITEQGNPVRVIQESDIDRILTVATDTINANGSLNSTNWQTFFYLNNTVTYPYKIEVVQDGTYHPNDCILEIDGQGFQKINSNVENNNSLPNDTYILIKNGIVDVTVLHTNDLTFKSKFGIEVTQTSYNWYVNDVLVHTELRTVKYSSTVGTIANTSVLPYLTSTTFNANTVGTGRIIANMNGLLSLQELNVVDNRNVTITPPASNNCYSVNDLITATLTGQGVNSQIVNITGLNGTVVSNVNLSNNTFTISGTSGNVQITLSCNNKKIVLPITFCQNLTCTKTVNLTVKCGTAPYSIEIIEFGTTNNLAIPASTNLSTFSVNYTIPKTSTPKDYIGTIKDSTGKIIGIFKKLNVIC